MEVINQYLEEIAKKGETKLDLLMQETGIDIEKINSEGKKIFEGIESDLKKKGVDVDRISKLGLDIGVINAFRSQGTNYEKIWTAVRNSGWDSQIGESEDVKELVGFLFLKYLYQGVLKKAKLEEQDFPIYFVISCILATRFNQLTTIKSNSRAFKSIYKWIAPIYKVVKNIKKRKLKRYIREFTKSRSQDFSFRHPDMWHNLVTGTIVFVGIVISNIIQDAI